MLPYLCYDPIFTLIIELAGQIEIEHGSFGRSVLVSNAICRERSLFFLEQPSDLMELLVLEFFSSVV